MVGEHSQEGAERLRVLVRDFRYDSILDAIGHGAPT
jgi:hypothetical protein